MHALSFCHFGFKHERFISFYTFCSGIDKNSPLIKCFKVSFHDTSKGYNISIFTKPISKLVNILHMVS